jgi:iron complex outermembrane receptor protein
MLMGASLTVGLAVAPLATVQAAENEVVAAAAGDALERVTVTAQKREGDLQTTPISISVFGGQDMEDRHIQSLEDLGDGAIPSLRVEPFFTRSSALIISMRGIGAMLDANQPNRDQGVGVYVDGVYLGRAQGLGAALYDVERIEVAKGPQGTLFGRNTEGGAISIVTRKPSGEFGMNATAGVSNFGGYKAEDHIDLPAFHDVSVKIDALATARDGTVTDPLMGQPNFNSYDKRGLRLAARWAPSPEFSADYAYDNSYDATTPYYAQLLTRGSVAMSPLAALQPDRARTANLGVPLQMSVGETNGNTLIFDWKLATDLELKSISSFRQMTQTQYDDGETNLSTIFSSNAPTGTFGRYSQANFWQHQSSEELQLIGSAPQVAFVVGAFYYHEVVRDNAWTPNVMQWNGNATSYTVLVPPVPTSPFPDRASNAQSDSLAAYGQATWTPAVADGRAHLTLGGRYSSDRKEGTLTQVNGALPVINTAGGPIAAAIPMDKTWNRFDPLAVLAYDLTPEVGVYGRWSTGYKAGGANSRSYTYRAFDPESVSMTEFGVKSEFLQRRARANLAVFTGTYKDAQIDFNALIVGSNRGTVETTNAAGSGHTQGVEGDFSLLLSKGLAVTASYAYNHVTLPQAPNPFANNALTAVYALNTPTNAASLALDYDRDVAGATLHAHVDANYSGAYHSGASDPTLTDTALVVNGRVALSEMRLNASGARLQLSIWSRNLLNEQHVYNKSFNASLGTYGIFNEPRTYGVDANIRF